MVLEDRLRELLIQGLGQQPSDGAMQVCKSLCATELHRVYGTVLSSARLTELRSRLEEGDFDPILLLTAEFPWSEQVVDAVVEKVVHHAVEKSGSSREEADWRVWPPPPTTLDEGRALVRELIADRGGVQALKAWPSLPAAEPSSLRLIADRVEAEAGIRLALLANRAGTTNVCSAAIEEVVASVVEDSGSAEGLGQWGSHLMDVDAAAVEGGTGMRVRLWSSAPVAEPVRAQNSGKIRYDSELLNRCGLATLHPDERGPLLRSMYDEVEMRVGSKLSENMSNAELVEFEHLIDANDDAAQSTWLAAHCPDYPQVVEQLAVALEVELRQAVPTLLAALGTVPGGDS